MAATEPVYISYLNYIGSGAPADGDQITSDNSQYPLNCVYTDKETGIRYVRKATTKVAATDWQAGESGATTVTVYQLKTVLTDAQIKALPTTSVEVVPAPGPGKAIYAPCALQLGQAVLKINWHGNYSNIDVNGRIVFDLAFIAYTGYRNTNSMTDFFAWGENGPAWLLGGNDVIASGVNYNGISDWENQPLMLRIQNNDSGLGNLTGGDPANTLEVTVFYSIVDL